MLPSGPAAREPSMRVLFVSVLALGSACRLDNALQSKAPDENPAGEDSATPGCEPETEVCDGVDNDCDGDIDEGLDQTWYADTDGDGFGDPEAPTQACAQPDDHVPDDTDCDDADSSVHPGAAERCNEADDDCDTEVDEDLPLQTWYADADGDGWGDPDAPIEDCRQPSGTTDVLADCDDDDPTRHWCRSCLEVLEQGRSVGDGVYTLDPPGCGEVSLWCDMTTDGGGWTGIVEHNTSTDGCPGDWQLESLSFADVCTRKASTTADRIRTATFDVCDIPFAEIRGNATLYQNGSTDAFGDFPSASIDDAYGDVVSVTLGNPRTHLFSYVFGFKAGGSDDSNCPAIGGAPPHAWIGGNFLCATGNPSSSTNERIWYDTPLFSADWWQVSVGTTTTENLEVRLIGTHVSADEDMGVETLDLLIR